MSGAGADPDWFELYNPDAMPMLLDGWRVTNDFGDPKLMPFAFPPGTEIPPGGFLLVIADSAARTLISPMQLPVGVLTALLGVPTFLFLLRRQARA